MDGSSVPSEGMGEDRPGSTQMSHDPNQFYLVYSITLEDSEPNLKPNASTWLSNFVANQSVKGEAELVKRVEIRK